MIRSLLAAALLLSLGCHAKFKKYAPTVGTARVQVITTGGPYVHLGEVNNVNEDGTANLVGSVINVVQGVKSINLTQRIADAVKVNDVNAAFQRGLIDTMGVGPPFGLNTDQGTPALLQIELESYGLDVPTLGAAGRFTYTARARVYTAEGKRIYSHRLTCETGVGDPDAAAVVLQVVNNVKQLKEMSDEQINDTFTAIADYCGGRLVTKMRRHAG